MTDRPPTRARRVLTFGSTSLVLLAAVTACTVLLNVMADRVRVRLDATSTGEHRLSPRTRALLAQLEGDYEVVIVADPRSVDGRALGALLDVAGEMRHAVPAGASFRATMIDPARADGRDAYAALVERLVTRERARIELHAATIDSALDALARIAAYLDHLGGVEGTAGELARLAAQVPADAEGAAALREGLEQRATAARLNARAVRQIDAQLRARLDEVVESLGIPDYQSVRAALVEPLSQLSVELGATERDAALLADSPRLPDGAKAAARQLERSTRAVRDRAATAADSLVRLPTIDALRVARAVQGATVGVVVGPPERGVTALAADTLFPTDTGGARIDAHRHAEDMLATALGALARPIKPILVLTHGLPGRVLGRPGYYDRVVSRLGLRGIDVLEWPVHMEPEPPSTRRLDPRAERPVIFMVFGLDTSASAQQAPDGTVIPSGSDRAAELGRALQAILDQGHPALVSLLPSVLPSYGETDPIARPLRDLGIEADSGRTLLSESFTAEGRRVEAARVVRGVEADHPVTRAVRGIPTLMEWPIALSASESPGVRSTVLLRVEGEGVWAESEWLGFARVPRRDHRFVTDPPSPGGPRDGAGGPWSVAVAAERTVPGLDGPQRVVVVGSNTWYRDDVALQEAEIDGRRAPAFPGNMELLEASVYWLARQDDLIGQGPVTRSIALVRELSPRTLLILRWALSVGLPALVLAIGVAWRATRG